jgi:hypothetical protein
VVNTWGRVLEKKKCLSNCQAWCWECDGMRIRGRVMSGKSSFYQKHHEQHIYVNFLWELIKATAENLGLKKILHFTMEVTQIVSSHLVREWCLYNCPKVIKTPPQSPDLYVFEICIITQLYHHSPVWVHCADCIIAQLYHHSPFCVHCRLSSLDYTITHQSGFTVQTVSSLTNVGSLCRLYHRTTTPSLTNLNHNALLVPPMCIIPLNYTPYNNFLTSIFHTHQYFTF